MKPLKKLTHVFGTVLAKNEIITLKDVIIKNLQSKNTRLRNEVEKLEINLQEYFIKNNMIDQTILKSPEFLILLVIHYLKKKYLIF